MSKEAMKLALEAYIKAGIGNSTDFVLQKEAHDLAVEALAKQEQGEPLTMKMDVIVVNLVREGINKHRARELAEHFIKTATPQPKQEQGEPVAWMKEQWSPDCGTYFEIYRDDEMGWRDLTDWTPIYTAPPAAQPCPTCEALARAVMMDQTAHDTQRTWVGLTELEMAEFVKTMERGNFLVAIYDIEKKLKDKNK